MKNNNHVFINCPFDREYSQLLKCIIFTVVSLGYQPRLALESSDAGTARLNKIISLINESRISIHDLSRIKSTEKEQYYRLNMPFELGLDFGYKHYSLHDSKIEKKYLIIGSERYDYMKALSDISGIDIKYHANDVEKLIKAIRNWFVENDDLVDAPSPRVITSQFMDFNAVFYDFAIEQGYSDDEHIAIPIVEQIQFIEQFHEKQK